VAKVISPPLAYIVVFGDFKMVEYQEDKELILPIRLPHGIKDVWVALKVRFRLYDPNKFY
jgi:hypothetical protein